MARRRKSRKGRRKNSLHPDIKTSVLAVVLIGLALILFLSGFEKAGPVGNFFYSLLERLFGWGYYLIPVILAFVGVTALTNKRRGFESWTFVGVGFFIAAGLGIIDIVSSENGGLVGNLLGNLEILFGYAASLIIYFTILVASLLVALNVPLKLKLPERREKEKGEGEPKVVIPEALAEPKEEPKESKLSRQFRKKEEGGEKEPVAPLAGGELLAVSNKDYQFPPLSLLKLHTEKPTVGDLRANANIIKRTLESFGIPVEMGEITIGPKVTRYALKPAEGVKLSRITALNQDLSLALAAHPIRIEAPIPGKSLVGIEIPNKIGSIVRLGSLLTYPEFKKSGNLNFPLGRDVAGEPLFINLAMMPHLLIAGATGSGKSVTIHSLILSLLYKNSPETLRLILIDPKRVELSVYDGIPHLVAPVITEGKKSIAALRFAIQEMEDRYETLLKAGKRDVLSYNKGRKGDVMPYLVIVIDELADLMSQFGREIEGAIVRLAQMARATGIHLVVSTQRPSVEIITGLIKANITSRVALQVASQVDSRTILDAAGAEKLLGGGDMLFISSDLSKPRRIQGSYTTDEEVNAVSGFIKKQGGPAEENHIEEHMKEAGGPDRFQDFLNDDVEDDLYDEAVELVTRAGKASASLLQRRLRVGYARAARLLDIMEERGVIGPADGAKPREVYDAQENDDE